LTTNIVSDLRRLSNSIGRGIQRRIIAFVNAPRSTVSLASRYTCIIRRFTTCLLEWLAKRSSRTLQYQLVPHKLTIAVAAGDNRSSRGSTGDESRVPSRFVPRTYSIILPKACIRIWQNLWRYPSHATRRRLANFEFNSRISVLSSPKIIQSSKKFHSKLLSYGNISYIEFHIWDYIRDNKK